MNLVEAERWLERRVAAKRKASRPDILSDPDVFPEERACALDASPRKVVFCTRRAAKSFSFGLEVIHDSYDWPGERYLFLGMTREESKRIFWKAVLQKLDTKHGLGMRFNESSLTATMPNGAEVFIGAADANEQEMRKLLGQRYRRVCIDEAQDWTHTDLRDLVETVLGPACVDVGGSISVRGTPGKFLKGFFRQLTPISVQAGIGGARGTEPGWSLHCWDTSANTAMMPAEPGGKPERMCDRWARTLAQLKAAKPGVELTPAYRRQYLGEWVLDESNLVYRYLSGRNDFTGRLPEYKRGRWHFVLAIDLGYEDSSAFVILAYHDSDRCLYVLEAAKEKGLDISAVAIRAKAYIRRFEPDISIVDGSNKQAVAEMRNRHDLPLIAADKTGKADFIELMNADFITGLIKIDPQKCAPLIDEYAGLIWNDKSAKREEHPACENHACFVAGTMVETSAGSVPIERIEPGARVWTRRGLRSVTHWGPTGNKEIVRVVVSSGRVLTGTPDHPIWTENRGWIPLGALLASDVLVTITPSCETKGEPAECVVAIDPPPGRACVADTIVSEKTADPSRNFAPISEDALRLWNGAVVPGDAGLKLEAIQIANTSSVQANGSIGQSGGQSTGSFHRACRSITAMEMLRTTLRRIWNLFLGALINVITRPPLVLARNGSGSEVWWLPEKSRRYGMLLPKAEHGTGSMDCGSRQHGRMSSASAMCVAESSSPRVELAAFVVERVTLADIAPVYALTVDDAHEYFANGVLVSNCDAALYGWRKCYQFLSELPKPPPPAPGTPAWNAQEVAEMERLAQEELEARQEVKANAGWEDEWPT